MQKKIGLLGIMVISAATIAWAESQTDQSQLAAQVSSALEKCDWKVRNTNGGPKGLMLLHQAKMRKVLEEIKAGRSVDPKQLAAVMEGHS
ncbi:MAG: hypothetical protein ACM3TN_25260 [Alphaproteobacteria bacterium]